MDKLIDKGHARGVKRGARRDGERGKIGAVHRHRMSRAVQKTGGWPGAARQLSGRFDPTVRNAPAMFGKPTLPKILVNPELYRELIE
ncbi:hypothetical protein GCM10027419_04230 [Pandoraea terrae]